MINIESIPGIEREKGWRTTRFLKGNWIDLDSASTAIGVYCLPVVRSYTLWACHELGFKLFSDGTVSVLLRTIQLPSESDWQQVGRPEERITEILSRGHTREGKYGIEIAANGRTVSWFSFERDQGFTDPVVQQIIWGNPKHVFEATVS
ncbi:hypothetical protein GYA49_05730 [Candidatus Beckwithbacteria bacterium]|nr:hypothetical protein [Candidatus Beckwithbacteria bacterium]